MIEWEKQERREEKLCVLIKMFWAETNKYYLKNKRIMKLSFQLAKSFEVEKLQGCVTQQHEVICFISTFLSDHL